MSRVVCRARKGHDALECPSNPGFNTLAQFASQFVMNLAIVSDGQAENEYKFSYVSAQKVPPGHWHWTLKNNHGKRVYALQSAMGPRSPGINVEVPPDYRAVPVPTYPKGKN